jgi:ATP-dependent DNA helicase RecG
MTQPPHPGLSVRLDALRGVGPERASQLARLGLATLGDLLLHRPRRHEDRRARFPIRDLTLDSVATVRGRIVTSGVHRFRGGSRSVFQMVVDDGTARLHCRWWNLPFLQNSFRVGEEVFIHGRPVLLKPRTMDHPETEPAEAGDEDCIHLNRLVPIYPLTEGLPQRWLRQFVWHHLPQALEAVEDPWPAAAMPPGVLSRREALRALHFPGTPEALAAARDRLALDELITLQLALQTRRRKLESVTRGLPCRGDNRLIKPLLSRLGFTLTPSQTEVLRTVRHDLAGAHPMRRLLQGDVGCGKTVVAACAALMTLESDHGVALMAPTEILAEQHFSNLARWFEGFPVRLALCTGTRSETRGAAAGPILTVGTHALLEDSCELPRLGLVIIDEQHKFGVAQREALLRKGSYPHLLVMTATPIPRTLGLTLYGDLDVSVIRHPPGGRGRIRTHVRAVDALPRVWRFVKQRLAEGRQAYVVYPRVEDSGASGLKAVRQEHTRLAAELAPFDVGLLHGRLPAGEKQDMLDRFRAGKIHVLVATSVIEVGIDVPNATVMVVEEAGQFGLAQLHQLRGRIGRGSLDAHCILVADLGVPQVRTRLEILRETGDGFAIAEADLKLRGPGELTGQDQSGMPRFRFADLVSDLGLVESAREIARRLLDAAPTPSSLPRQVP